MRKVTLSDISRRDWGKITNDGLRNRLSYNYALAIQKSVSGKRNRQHPERAFGAIFGDMWYLQPYAKLKAIAKMLPYTNVEMHSPYEFTRDDRALAKYDIEHHSDNKINNSSYYRVALRYFTKSAVAQYAASVSYARRPERYIGAAVLGYKAIRAQDKTIARNIKTAPKGMNKCVRYYDLLRDLSNEKMQEIPAYLRDGIINDYKYYALREALCDDNAWDRQATYDTFLYEELDVIFRLAHQTRWYSNKDYYRCRLYKAIDTYYKDKKLICELKKLGLEPRNYGNNLHGAMRLNTKFRAMVRTTLHTKVSDKAKRNTIMALSDTIHDNMHTNRRYGWTPSLYDTTINI